MSYDLLNQISISFNLEQVSLRQDNKSCRKILKLKTLTKESIIIFALFDREKVKGIWKEFHQQLHSQKYQRGAQRYQLNFFCKTLLSNIL